MTSERYAGFENENSYRNYPFAESAVMADSNGTALPADVFVDAFLYPVSPVQTDVVLTVLDFAAGGRVEVVATETGEAFTGNGADGTVELHDARGRHVGTMMCGPGWEREEKALRRMEFDGLPFAPSAVSVIVHDGVFGFDAGRTTSGRRVEFRGDGCITPVLANTARGPELSFDVQDDSAVSSGRVVRKILFVAFGKTVFDISRQSDNTILLATPSIDRDDVCWQAHMEDAVASVSDTCPKGDDPPECPPEPLPFKTVEIGVCPSEIGDVNIVAEDVIGLKNPVHVSTVEGPARMNSPQIRSDMSGQSSASEGSKLLDRQVQVGNGIRISIPGIGNGR